VLFFYLIFCLLCARLDVELGLNFGFHKSTEGVFMLLGAC
jgi:hypothetical protein